MADLVTRPIGWILQAPIHLQAHGTSTASPDAVFEVLADHERWPEWFPSVKKVEVTGPAKGVGARRRVTVPGMVVDEEFIVWEPGERWSFTGTAAKPKFTRSLVEDVQLTARADGGTDISYSMYLDPPHALRPVVRLVGRSVQSNIRKAVANLARRAAAG